MPGVSFTGKRLVFMGSPDFAIPALDALRAANDIVAVYTQPPRRAGRGMQEQKVPLARHAEACGITVHCPASLQDPAVQAELAAFNADVFVVVAYGLLLPRAVLDLPRYGCINGHASLLPRWRGAAPIQRAIAAGDTQTGMSAMLMEEGLDTGPVLDVLVCDIAANETAGSLHDKLAQMNAALLTQVVAALPEKLASAQPQDANAAVYAAKISPAESAINWRSSLTEIDRHIRAFSPFPGTWFAGPRGRIKINAAVPVAMPVAIPVAMQVAGVGPGCFLGLGPDGQMRIAVCDGVLEIATVQPAGKKPMPARDFLNGQPLPVGHLFATAADQDGS